MSSTSKKHRNFVSEPMSSKRATELAGIGEVLGQRLQARGYRKADQVLGQFLVVNKNEGVFTDWMKSTVGANQKQATDCYRCLKDWSDQFL